MAKMSSLAIFAALFPEEKTEVLYKHFTDGKLSCIFCFMACRKWIYKWQCKATFMLKKQKKCQKKA